MSDDPVRMSFIAFNICGLFVNVVIVLAGKITPADAVGLLPSARNRTAVVSG